MTSDSVAIIGVAVRVPGAASAAQFWRNLRDGTCSIEPVPDEALLAAGIPPAALTDSDYVKVAAAAPDLDLFDAGLFSMSPREAQLCDPQLRLFLETAHAAVLDAGYATRDVVDVGVFASSSTSDYAHHVRQVEDIDPRSAEGMALASWNSPDSVASLVSYKLNLRGPSIGVVSACSSSLVAVHLAVKAVLADECEMAIAGGADISVPVRAGHWWGSGGPLSRTGCCRPFDAAADGTVFGSGGGAVLLKRTRDALADGDHIYAVVDGSMVNSDGGGKVGFSAPGVAGQAAVVAEALTVAGVSPHEISYVEGHATATALGDPIEVTALTRAFRALGDTRVGECTLGSVKGNIGHLGHASGIASLVKTTLALHHREIPGTVGFENANPGLGLELSPFRVESRATPWTKADGATRRGAVSSFGFGGTNAQLVLSEAPGRHRPPDDGRAQLVVWSGETPSARDEATAMLAEHFPTLPPEELGAAAATLARGRDHYSARAAAVGTSTAELTRRLTSGDDVYHGVADPHPRVCFLYPGQGSQHPRMAAGLAQTHPVFGEALSGCLDRFVDHGLDLRSVFADGDADELQPTLIAQPLIFTVAYALTKLWRSLGVSPDVVLGHSLGELAAAAASGVLSEEWAVAVVAARARAMTEMPPGGLMAVSGSLAEVRAMLPPEAAVAIHNGPRQVIVGGRNDTLDLLGDRWADLGVSTTRLRTAHAFHTPAGRGSSEAFTAALQGVPFDAPTCDVYSAAHGGRVGPEQLADPQFWGRQLREPVHFADALQTLRADTPGRLVFVEIGPGQALTGLTRLGLADSDGTHAVIPSLPPREADEAKVETGFLRAVGAAWVEGVDIVWPSVFLSGPARRISLPGYPYQRRRYWVDGVPQDSASAPGAAEGSATRDRAPDDHGTEVSAGHRDAAHVVDRVAHRWAEVIGLPARGLSEDFFAAGGDSLAAVGLVSNLRREFGVDLDLETFLEEPTVEGLARRLAPAAFGPTQSGSAMGGEVPSPGTDSGSMSRQPRSEEQ